jgi:capsular exopolysaccharide synthesis family protein
MSKFFNETQKARQRATNPADPLRLDVVSVMDAIKQHEVEVTGPLEVSSPTGRQIRVDKTVNGLITGGNNDSSHTDRAVEAYRTLRTRVMRLQASKDIRSIMVTSALPSEGKTVTSLNLAHSCAQLHGVRILLVDGDLRSRGLTRLLGISEGVGLSDVLSGKSLRDEVLLSTEHINLTVVGAGSSSGQPPELFASPRWSEFIAWANQSFDVIIVDAPPIQSLADAELIGAGCDGALVVVRALSTPRVLAEKCTGRLDKKKLMGIVFNGRPSGPENHYGYYGAPYGSNTQE